MTIISLLGWVLKLSQAGRGYESVDAEPPQVLSELLGCRRRKYVRPRRQPDREGRANVETLNSVVVFPGIGKHASKQHKHDGNRDQERGGVYEGEIRGLVYANHFGSQRADRTVSEPLETPPVSVHASAKQHVKILEKGRWQ